MNGLKNFGISMGVLALGTVMASAHPLGGRVFTYDCNLFANYDYSYAGDVHLSTPTKVIVKPYLYVAGCIGVSWQVDGWGSAADGKIENINIFHNETLALDFRHWDNLAKVSGTNTGDQTIAMDVRAAVYNGQTNALVFDSGLTSAPSINALMGPSSPLFPAAATNGFLRLDLTRQIWINAATGPGTYENHSQIVLVRS